MDLIALNFEAYAQKIRHYWHPGENILADVIQDTCNEIEDPEIRSEMAGALWEYFTESAED